MAKQNYRAAKRKASEEYSRSVESADENYKKAMAERNSKLDAIDRKYNRSQSATDRYYNRKNEEIREQMDEERDRAEFFENDSFLGSMHEMSYYDLEDSFNDTNRQYAAKSYTNQLIRDSAKEKIKSEYSESSEKAYKERGAAYEEAGRKYIQSLMSARKTYKKEKNNYQR